MWPLCAPNRTTWRVVASLERQVDMDGLAPFRVRCKQGTLIVAGDRISLDPGPLRVWHPRWSVPASEIADLTASRGIGITFTLTFDLVDGRKVRADWILPYDAQRVVASLGYDLTLYDLYEMAAEHELGTPFAYDLIQLAPVPPSIPVEEERQPVVRILPASETPAPPPAVPSQLPPALPRLADATASRLRAVRGALFAVAIWLLHALAALLRIARAGLSSLRRSPVLARVHSPVWLSRATSTMVPRADSWRATATATLSTVAARSLPQARDRLNTLDASLRQLWQTPPSPDTLRQHAAAFARAFPRLMRSRVASAVIVVALILAVIAASALDAAPPRSPQPASSDSAEIIRVLPHRALGNLSNAPLPTQVPAPTPTPTPHPQPPAPPPPPPPPTLILAFTCAWAQDGGTGQVCVHTLAGASLTITITYCDGRTARNKSLQGAVTANASGNYVWTWTPDTRCLGPATAVVNARWNGQSVTRSTTFDVTFSPLPPSNTPVPLAPAWYQ